MSGIGGYYDPAGRSADFSALLGVSRGQSLAGWGRSDAALFAGAAMVSNARGCIGGDLRGMPLTWGKITVASTGIDSEVNLRSLAEAYRQEGDACVDCLQGKFALALYDADAHRLLLARDAYGKGSLFCMREGDRLWFSSYRDGLWRAAGERRKDLTAGIWELLPGECLWLSRKGLGRVFLPNME